MCVQHIAVAIIFRQPRSGASEPSRHSLDYNDYAAEMGDERYILNLILRVITVSLETVKIVKSLPPLNIHKLDQ